MSPKVEELFRLWITVSTWYTGHAQDEGRFFRFVWKVLAVSRKRPSASEIREKINATWSGKLEEGCLEDRAIHYSQLYETLCEFADAKNEKRFFMTDSEGNPIL